MSGANIFFIVVGGIAILIGLVMLATSLKGREGDQRKHTALLMAGMMVLAFGLILAGFAIAYATTDPYDFTTSNAGAN
jgi:hypothetical protein